MSACQSTGALGMTSGSERGEGARRGPPDLLPERYRRWRASALGTLTETIESGVVLGALGDVAGRRVLDVGCGDGSYAIALAGQGARVIGADLSAEMVHSARSRARSVRRSSMFVRADLKRLPFPDRSFDAVLAVTVLCFTTEVATALREVHRVLAPGGRLVLGELHRWSLWALWRRVRGVLGSPIWRVARFRSPRQLRRSLEAAGFVVESIRGAIYYPPWAPAARILWRADRHLARLSTAGAAFLVLAARHPPDPPAAPSRVWGGRCLGSVSTGAVASASTKGLGCFERPPRW